MKAIKLLPDRDVPRDSATVLRGDGFDCRHVGEIGMSQSDDGEILESAADMGRVIVTRGAVVTAGSKRVKCRLLPIGGV